LIIDVDDVTAHKVAAVHQSAASLSTLLRLTLRRTSSSSSSLSSSSGADPEIWIKGGMKGWDLGRSFAPPQWGSGDMPPEIF